VQCDQREARCAKVEGRGDRQGDEVFESVPGGCLVIEHDGWWERGYEICVDVDLDAFERLWAYLVFSRLVARSLRG
jgi:hypothetical protein